MTEIASPPILFFFGKSDPISMIAMLIQILA